LVLHDGPPYANGDLHMGKAPVNQLTIGHALNKILKDIILRYNILQRRKVSYIPGWDCHGLPIELKAVKSKSEKELSASIIRNIARRFAEKTVLKQMDEFKGWAVTGDWENRWCTMGIHWNDDTDCRSGIRDSSIGGVSGDGQER
jgi:isoleucyl-tRNA synthetase